MRASEIDWPMLRGAMILLALSVLVAVSALMASYSFAARQESVLQQERSGLLAARGQYHALDEEEDIIATYLPRYVALEERGIIGREQRLDWIDVLRESARAVRLQDLSYVITAQQPFDPGMDLEIGDYRVWTSSMRVTLGLLHEGDLLDLIARMRQELPGLFGVTGCRISRTDRTLKLAANAINVEARCTLNFITIHKPAPPAGAS